MRNQRSETWPRWIIFGALVIAISAAWAFGSALLLSPWMDSARWEGPIEHIEFTYAGEPVIVTYSGMTPGAHRPPRLLNGEAIDEDVPRVPALDAHSFRSRNSDYLPPTWQDRLQDVDLTQSIAWSDLAGTGEPRYREAVVPQAAWYLISEGGPSGRGYFVGFNRSTNRSLGALGRKGWTTGAPPREDQFVLGNLFHGKTCQLLQPRDGSGSENFLWFLLDGDDLVSVNLHTRAVRTVATFSEAKFMALVNIFTRESARRIALRGIEEHTPADAPVGNPVKLIVWSGNELSLVNPLSGERTDFALPETAPRDGTMQLYAIHEGQLAVSYADSQETSRRATLARLAPRGEGGEAQPQTEEVTLAGSRRYSLSANVREMSVALPSPLLMTLAGLVLAPFSALQPEVTTYAERVRLALDAQATAMIVIVALSAALAWWVYRIERSQYQAHAARMAALVLVLGVPGFLAYLAERRPTPVGRCAGCGANMPQNRDRCPACTAERARPQLTGVEVFA